MKKEQKIIVFFKNRMFNELENFIAWQCSLERRDTIGSLISVFGKEEVTSSIVREFKATGLKNSLVRDWT